MCTSASGNLTVAALIANEGKYIRDWNQNGANAESRGFFESMHTGDWYSQIFPSVQKINVKAGLS